MRRIIRNVDQHSSSVPDKHDCVFTFEEAELLARSESIRDLLISQQEISYVRYSQDFDDYCRVRIRFERPDEGAYEMYLLPLSERLVTEALDLAKIASVARANRRLSAVRLYRHLHGCSLQEAVDGVESLLTTARE